MRKFNWNKIPAIGDQWIHENGSIREVIAIKRFGGGCCQCPDKLASCTNRPVKGKKVCSALREDVPFKEKYEMCILSEKETHFEAVVYEESKGVVATDSNGNSIPLCDVNGIELSFPKENYALSDVYKKIKADLGVDRDNVEFVGWEG